MKRFENKVAVVVGCARGIGQCMVERLVEEGAKVAALDLDMATLEETYAGHGEEIFLVKCDVSKKASVDEAIAKVVEHFGRIDVAFSNAGII